MSGSPEFKPPNFPNTDGSSGQVGDVYAKWAGSSIQIEDPTQLARDLLNKGDTRVILKKADPNELASAVRSVRMTGQAVSFNGEDYLKLTTSIIPSQDLRLEFGDLVTRFSGYIEPEHSKDDTKTHQTRGQFDFYTTDTKGLMVIYDNILKVNYALKLKNNVVRLSNHRSFEPDMIGQAQDPNAIHPPTMRYPEVAEQIKSFAVLTVMINDFMAGFWANDPRDSRMNGVAMGLEYLIGDVAAREQRLSSLASSIGKSSIGLKPGNPGKMVDQVNQAEIADVEADDATVQEFKVTLKDIGGLTKIKEDLKGVATLFGALKVTEKWGVKLPTGIIFYGEPGTGKTMLAIALANEIGAEMRTIQASDIYGRYMGDSEGSMKRVFEEALEHEGPVVLFFDEIDLIIGTGGNRTTDAVVGIFEQEMSTLRSKKTDILVLAATNHIDNIDPAILRSGRFDYKFDVPMPDQAARAQIFKNLLFTRYSHKGDAFFPFDLDVNTTTLAVKTDKMSGADIAEIIMRAALDKAIQEVISGEPQQPITTAELEAVIKSYHSI